jgi:hypothetical protein
VKGNTVFRRQTINVNPVLAYNHRALIGLLVHEYHHKLNAAHVRYGYLDEFAAHMKEFSITRPEVTESEAVEYINRHLTAFYSDMVSRWTAPSQGNNDFNMGKQLVKRFADLGDFLIPDNNAARAPTALMHYCLPIPGSAEA